MVELEAIIDSAREIEYAGQKFVAALKGIDLEENKGDSKFDEVKNRVEDELAGGENMNHFKNLGIEIEEI